MKSTMKLKVGAMVVMLMMVGQGRALVLYFDGGTHTISSEINDYVWVDYNQPGKKTTFILDPGGSVANGFNLDGYRDSRLSINGGSVGWDLIAHDNCLVTMTNGAIGNALVARNNSVVNLYGGTIGAGIQLEDDAKLSIYGIHYALNGIQVEGGQFLTLPNNSGLLSVTFDGGQTIDYQLDIIGTGIPAIYLGIPEPATFGLLMVGGVVMRKRYIW
jgi:hypothetical protein